MPDWDRVNARKTPTAYSGIRRCVLPPNMITRKPAEPARIRMPLENTRRSPRLASWRGTKRSRARMDDSRGKSAKAVFAATIRMDAVANCSR